MSAYIVQANHIIYLVTAATTRHLTSSSEFRWCHNGTVHTLPATDHERAADVANMLWRENIASVSARYPGESSATLPGPRVGAGVIAANEFTRVRWTRFEAVQVIKACKCYEYQSCEHAGWETSEAYAFINSLRSSVLRALPGYEAAEWGAPEPEFKVRQVVRLT